MVGLTLRSVNVLASFFVESLTAFMSNFFIRGCCCTLGVAPLTKLEVKGATGLYGVIRTHPAHVHKAGANF